MPEAVELNDTIRAQTLPLYAQGGGCYFNSNDRKMETCTRQTFNLNILRYNLSRRVLHT